MILKSDPKPDFNTSTPGLHFDSHVGCSKSRLPVVYSVIMTLRITIKNASDLPNVEKEGKLIDPYVAVKFRGE